MQKRINAHYWQEIDYHFIWHQRSQETAPVGRFPEIKEPTMDQVQREKAEFMRALEAFKHGREVELQYDHDKNNFYFQNNRGERLEGNRVTVDAKLLLEKINSDPGRKESYRPWLLEFQTPPPLPEQPLPPLEIPRIHMEYDALVLELAKPIQNRANVSELGGYIDGLLKAGNDPQIDPKIRKELEVIRSVLPRDATDKTPVDISAIKGRVEAGHNTIKKRVEELFQEYIKGQLAQLTNEAQGEAAMTNLLTLFSKLSTEHKRELAVKLQEKLSQNAMPKNYKLLKSQFEVIKKAPLENFSNTLTTAMFGVIVQAFIIGKYKIQYDWDRATPADPVLDRNKIITLTGKQQSDGPSREELEAYLRENRSLALNLMLNTKDPPGADRTIVDKERLTPADSKAVEEMKEKLKKEMENLNPEQKTALEQFGERPLDMLFSHPLLALLAFAAVFKAVVLGKGRDEKGKMNSAGMLSAITIGAGFLQALGGFGSVKELAVGTYNAAMEAKDKLWDSKVTTWFKEQAGQVTGMGHMDSAVFEKWPEEYKDRYKVLFYFIYRDNSITIGTLNKVKNTKDPEHQAAKEAVLGKIKSLASFRDDATKVSVFKVLGVDQTVLLDFLLTEPIAKIMEKGKPEESFQDAAKSTYKNPALSQPGVDIDSNSNAAPRPATEPDPAAPPAAPRVLTPPAGPAIPAPPAPSPAPVSPRSGPPVQVASVDAGTPPTT